MFVANRGEVAVRVARACDALGIVAVLGVSEADANAPYTDGREIALLGGARSSESYLNRVAVVDAARRMRCSAVHPGWGFLAEDPVFAQMCADHGLQFIGPSPHVMATMGKKSPAKAAMKAAGLPVIDGSDGPLHDVAQGKAIAERVGYPVLLKAESGGGGRGMRVVERPQDFQQAFEQASSEAFACFSDARVYLEKYITGGRHIEIQVLADRYGNAVHLGERDCTLQRHHQKLLEESPAVVLSDEVRNKTLELARKATIAIGYEGAGTIEFLLTNDGVLRFMEMNTRLQVEHPVSEMRTGIDLVQEQLQIAAGARLSMTQNDISFDGHAIEFRINAEDPYDDFRPSPGRIEKWRPPSGKGIRVDTHVVEGYRVPPYYDSLLAKLIVHGRDRNEAIARSIAALSAFQCEGVATTIPFHLAILQNNAFQNNAYDTASLPDWRN
ncbi:MAG: acetyl-CoA carboxylase biotin carboxylase subunit [Polyangiales bacterium]